MPVFTRENQKILFIHVPKTAGSSINKLFLKNGFEMSYYSEGSINRYKNLCGPQHMDQKLLKEEFDNKDFTYVFSVYRDPIDRHLSEFTWAPWGLMGRDIYTPELFEEWCPKIFKEYKTNPYRFDNHIRPQNEFFDEIVDVYNFDTISSIPIKLCEKLDLKIIELPYERSSRKKDKEYIIYEDTIELIENFYKRDYEWLENNQLL